MSPPPAPRILLVRFSSIGDVLLTTPLVRALRARHPAAEITFVTKAAYAPLVRDNPRIDRVLTLESGAALRPLAASLRAARFTHLLDLHGSTRSRALRLLVPGRWRGYRHHRLARTVLIRWKRDVYPRHLPVAERYFDAARDLDVLPDKGPPELHLESGVAAGIERWLAARGLGSRPFLAFAPGAAHATKRWPPEYWRELTESVISRGWDVAFTGGAEDAPLARELARSGGLHAVSAAGEFSLQETGALLARARALVSGDTGVMHMATAVATPVVALFGPTVRQFGFFPYSPASVVLEVPLDCRPCTAWGTARCPLGHHRCLRDLAPVGVLEALPQPGT